MAQADDTFTPVSIERMFTAYVWRFDMSRHVALRRHRRRYLHTLDGIETWLHHEGVNVRTYPGESVHRWWRAESRCTAGALEESS